MGSEQYCLRWNNHQSNLLGVFSQLLQDESLVDVTLACSEGTSIRAHKVVLSACSSYFQSLFLDHPARHPIVILKDVRFAELRTLIEFMYKGEVNVEYCQLSALLKTAESLKVKGLAEMTNQSTASKEPERDRDSDRLRLHTPTTPSAAPSSSVKNEILELSSKQQRLDNDICSPSPPSRVPSSPGSSLSSIYQKKLLTTSASASATTTSITGSSSHHIDSIIKEEPTFNDHRTHHQHRNDESMEDDDDDDENIHMKNEVGLNMTLNSTLLQNSISSSVNSTSSLADMQSSRYSSNLLGNSSNAGGTRQQSPLSSDLPGPSGIGPMQHTPLSLKKEADWDRSDDKESSSSEYRHSHGDMESSTDVHGERSSSVVGLPISSSSSSELNSSVNSNNSGPIFPCMYCGQTFPHQSKLTRHILSHSLETLKYREVSHLLGHTQLGFLPHELPPPSHFPSRQVSMESLEPSDNSPIDMENPFGNNPGTSNSTNDPNAGGSSGGVVLCKFCGKSFPDVSSLITHLPVHTGDRPFKCEFCGKAFKLRHHMKDHCRVHTGERPFRCQMCGKTFSRSTILKAHEKTHYPKYRDRYQRFMAPKPSSSIMSGLHRLKSSSSTPQMSSTATSASMVPSMMPFHFPFSPFSLGLNLFDMTAANESRNSSSIDPSRILHILHQQSLLAEELLKYRALLGIPSPSTSTSSTSSSSNQSSSHPFFNDMKPSIEFFKIPNSHDTKFNKDIVHESEMIPSKRQTPSSSTEIDLTKDDGCSTPKIKARPESELLSEKSSTTSTTISPAAVSAMLIDPDELKCHICMANFPSLWLLEQHTALQHSQLSCSEKQNKCEHCGQNYRYNCCLQSTLLMNSQDHPGNPNRARIPADKLFTCDVCGMQFRYLKSFKKHRLNHALERLHGKKEMNENSGELMVSSTNDESGIPKGVISLEDEQMLLDDQDQDDTIDSISNTNSNMNFSSTNLINTKQMNDPNSSISADNNNSGGDIKDKSLISSAITECDKQETNGNITSSDKILDEMTDMANTQLEAESSSALNFTMPSLQSSFSIQGSSGSLKSLSMTNQNLMGLNSQEASILNFLRVDADKRDKRFACPFCGKCVRSKENLKLHVRKHTGERPFVCLFCGRAFGGKSDLTRHLRIHTGERPYHCESCGKCFARADYLSKHLTTHVHNTQTQQQR